MASARTHPMMVALAALAIAGTVACSPIQTAEPYNASDGVRVQLGSSLTAENLLIISAAAGEPGALIGGLTNRSGDDVRVTLAATGTDDVTVQVKAGVTVLLGSEDDAPLVLGSVGVAPGAVLPMTISTPAGGSQQVSVPVLDGSLSEYADLVPTPQSS